MLRTLAITAALAGASFAYAPSALAAGDAKVANTDAQGQVNESLTVLEHMKKDPDVVALLKRARGVLIVPRYAQGGLVVGARGGEGVLLVHNGDSWSDPVFYNIGGVSIGAQAGVGGGAMALVLMSQQALQDVMANNNFSLNAKAGLSVVNYSAKTQAGWGRADVVVWSDVKGAYAGATIGVSDIARDVQQTRSYYPGAANGDRVLRGQLRNPGAKMLVASLP